ncbi:ABC transporter permease [Staphylococcus pseudintermedius]|uniref:ABC transporter permease n=1 Tax=Staphylococcus pseudintermedius TaxID=283734 RepID=A0A2P5JDJ8_STAPS|nr:nickel/cobalt ABC transporter permease [Staphylococcus pseudintermedius]ADX77610.1 oligopeptide transport system permease protein, putative [Staphylococcus pseudintermedius ED99]ANQ82922.1 nickel ABC transporter permease subunit NikB [Staphylococcus pseudintermedius]ANQ89372.1 nickel ABC transporter permease subunit NikB [Staphylococcus pseudintermedius]AYG55324.1 ABC transporter permease [Staphylococcus pseudintermedius]EGQ0291003.1 ABC transporter permease [Staphylococcus pseudintermedius
MAYSAMKRLLLMIPLLIVISFLTFALTHLSSEDPAVVILHAQEVPDITQSLIEQTRAKYYLDAPFLVQYWEWLQSAVQLQFGHSFVTGEDVGLRLWPAFFNTLKLTLISSVAIIVLSLLFGILTALLRGTWFDRMTRTTAFVLTAIPSYWLAAILIIFLSVKLNALPTSGLTGPESYILPVAVITLGYTGIYFRNVRSAVIQQLDQDYVLYMRAMGVPMSQLLVYVARNAMQVVVSIFCMSIPIILGGSVVIENVFAWPGMGQLSVKAVLEQDFPMIQAYVLIVSVLFILFNTLADVINMWLNPKLREEH